MEFLRLLGSQLKDDAIIDVLEWGEMEVVYDFDRLHENQPDKYWAASKKHGFQFGFDSEQRLRVVFLYAEPRDGFSAIDRTDCDIAFFSTIADIEASAPCESTRITKGRAEFLGVGREWAKIDCGTYTVHYEFQAGTLAMVTVSNAK